MKSRFELFVGSKFVNDITTLFAWTQFVGRLPFIDPANVPTWEQADNMTPLPTHRR